MMELTLPPITHGCSVCGEKVFHGPFRCCGHDAVEIAYSTERVMGPSLPVAFCRCDARLQFERAVWYPLGRRTTGWRCHCEGCVDGETLSDGTSKIYVKSGEGQSPFEALDDLAAMHFDCEASELMREEPDA